MLLARHPLTLGIALVVALSPMAVRADDAPAEATADDAGRTLATIEVVGNHQERKTAEGTASVLDQSVIVSGRALTVNEALRKVPGVTVRDEEGFGLRPNIGIRGSNPTRSTKVLLLEDGLPAMYAPYGDNASYYHAPIQRYDRIEVLKGAGLLRFGPQTIHGAINYITPTPPEEFAGHVEVSAGTRGFGAVHASVGGQGLLVDIGYKRGEGARDNTDLEQGDVFAKYQRQINENHAIALRANLLRERSDVGYTGITDAEYANFGREYNPFGNDSFDIDHTAFSVSHDWRIGTVRLLTSAYYTSFERDWWRQSSNTTDTQCGTGFRNARLIGQRVDPDTCASAQGRLRNYYTWGVDSRLSFERSAFGTSGSSEVGVRWHEEKQVRYQRNGSSATARTGTLVENNLRTAEALSAFATTTFDFGSIQLTPSVRHERVDFARSNRLPGGLAGSDEVRETTWGLAANWRVSDTLSVYASAHEGFAPPRVEDLIAGNGTSTTVDAEHSRNFEAGLRTRWLGMIDLEAAAFRTDFDNQVVVGSIAGGSTPLAQGETDYRGFEFAIGVNRKALQTREGEVYANLAVTWLADAEQSTVLRRVDTGSAANGSIAGNRLPYAPELASTFRIGYVKGAWDGSVEVQHVGRQYADFANNRYPVDGSGQFGELDGYAVWSATLNWEPDITGWSAYVTVKNISDREYIVDRTRGILLGNPRQVVIGARYAW
ncbi:MAG: TonB-dependent receptor [Xanthomonadaceae bacterium]|nr:TonB-dependent receptor [Xanthomonadaceae bacterium]